MSWNGKHNETYSKLYRHTLTGVWVEILGYGIKPYLNACHTLTGVWVEMSITVPLIFIENVTPSRVCELKSFHKGYSLFHYMSHPHGCVSWNYLQQFSYITCNLSHPHGCVSWNALNRYELQIVSRHTLTGVWVEMEVIRILVILTVRHTLTGVWVEIRW